VERIKKEGRWALSRKGGSLQAIVSALCRHEPSNGTPKGQQLLWLHCDRDAGQFLRDIHSE